MKILWQSIGWVYLFFSRRRWVLRTSAVIVFLVQLILIIVLSVRLNAFKTEFDAYRNAALRMDNQIYSQTYMINTRVNEILEKIKK